MSSFDPAMISNKLVEDPSISLMVQKWCVKGAKRLCVMKEEVEQQLDARFNKDVHFQTWVANVVSVKKNKWKMEDVRQFIWTLRRLILRTRILCLELTI